MALFRKKPSEPQTVETFDDRFQTCLSRLESEAGRITERSELTKWAEASYGDYPYPSAVSFALEWREDCLADLESTKEGTNWASRVNRIWTSFLVVGKYPDAIVTIVRLGEALYDEGLLGPPYDEPAEFRGTEHDPAHTLNANEPGPGRLGALITLAAFARRLEHPRSEEWRGAAQSGLFSYPAGAAALTAAPGELLGELGLP